jgi:sorbitol-specific phosphotransferase system component IIBC
MATLLHKIVHQKDHTKISKFYNTEPGEENQSLKYIIVFFAFSLQSIIGDVIFYNEEGQLIFDALAYLAPHP